MSLNFITETVNVKRLTSTTGNKKEFVNVISNLEIDIQPNSPEAFGSDLIFEGNKGFIYTSDKNLLEYNDQLVSNNDGIVYYVKGTQFFQGYGHLESHLEVYLSNNKNT